MRIAVILIALGVLGTAGCESKQEHLAKLQDAYSKAHKQYYDDCVAPLYGDTGSNSYLKGTKPTAPTPQQQAEHDRRCQAELKRAGDLQQQLAAAASK